MYIFVIVQQEEKLPEQKLQVLRSSEMQYVTITIPNELVNETLRVLGNFGYQQVEDQSTNQQISIQLAYKKRQTQVGEQEKTLQNFEEQMIKYNVNIPMQDLEADIDTNGLSIQRYNPDIVISATDFVNEIDQQLQINVNFAKNIQTEISRRIEMRQTFLEVPNQLPFEQQTNENNFSSSSYDFSMDYLSDPMIQGDNNNNNNNDDNNEDGSDTITTYICGVIPTSNQSMFSHMIYRISRGSNSLVKFSSPISELIYDPQTNEKIQKSVFCVISLGKQQNRRIRKQLPLVGASIYPMPPSSKIESESIRLDNEIQEELTALHGTETTIRNTLQDIAMPTVHNDGIRGLSLLRLWQILLYHERANINILMRCEFHTTLIFMAGWCPLQQLENLNRCINDVAPEAGTKPALDYNAIPPANAIPPTYIQTTRFISSFQNIVNTYGTPRYQEINPGQFTIITFPFIFGVMYGDVGHGIILLIVSLLFIINEKKLLYNKKIGKMPEMLEMVFSGRYALLLMSICSIYCGFIYNEFLSLPLNIYGSNYKSDIWNNNVYPFGIDPTWRTASNAMIFGNSFRMKLSVILGVIHMVFGIMISSFNHIYFNDYVSLIFEFIPRQLQMLSTFGYMIIQIIIKWCIKWDKPSDAPNLIQTIINMFQSPGSIDEKNQVFPNQSIVQTIQQLIAFLSLPIMQLAKPIIIHKKMNGKFMTWLPSPIDITSCNNAIIDTSSETVSAIQKNDDDHGSGLGDDNLKNELSDSLSTSYQHTPSTNDQKKNQNPKKINNKDTNAVTATSNNDNDTEEPHTFGDLMIHQCIHTIEFALGTVSNTASYLRLWALSLAHGQLSEVFWKKMVFEYGLYNGLFGVIGIGIWVIATVGVIVCMDALECFLHALRLHWVEFQNKFFYGDGKPFEPFTFRPNSG